MIQERLQVKRAVEEAKRRYGVGFDKLGPDLQRAIVRAEALSMIAQGAAFEDTFAGRVATLALQWEAGE